MKFCSQCASPVAIRIPDGDTKERHIFEASGQMHDQNPKSIASCIPQCPVPNQLYHPHVEHNTGHSTIPAGFMENSETIEQAAMRETYEEACARVEISGLYAIFNIPHVNQVYMIFRAELLDGEFAPGIESLETALFSETEIPWSDIAFPVVIQTLQRFFADRPGDHFPPFVDTISSIKR